MIHDGALPASVFTDPKTMEEELKDRLLNVDEMGLDPEDKKLRIMTFAGTKHPLVLATSEHAPFWVTALHTD